MKILLRLEEIALFLGSIYFFGLTDFAWWWFPVLLLAPDISMLGYLINNRVGAYLYNFFHHRAIALVILGLGLYGDVSAIILVGIILFAHSTMDRIFGYGLKFSDSFSHTHLGKIGQ